MFDFLQSAPTLLVAVLGFVLTISFLVAIHEYGHFWMARKFGVKIEKFSVGFGKPIVKWYGKRDNTEYSISWIPLGGYVKMYGENPNELSDDSTPQKSSDQITQNTLESEQNPHHDVSDITDINDIGNSTGSFYALSPSKRFLIAFAGPAVNLAFAVLALWFLFVLGVPAFKPYVGSVQPQSVFAAGNIQRGDKIIAINGSETTTMTDATMHFIDSIGSHTTHVTTQDKNGIQNTATLDFSQLPKGSELMIDQALGFQWEITETGKNVPATLDTVVKNSPADKAGLLSADTVIQANGTAINNWQALVNEITNHPQQAMNLVVQRGGSTRQLTLTPGRHPDNPQRGYAGITPNVPADLYQKYRSIKQYGLLAALPMAIKENYLQAKLTLKVLGRMITGKASIKNMGGPLTIADYSGKTLRMGYVEYLKFLAAISLTLAVMNLLPIPVLDGGHMTLCAIEMVRGKPVSDRTADLLLRFGMSIVLTFMILVLTIDFWKYLIA